MKLVYVCHLQENYLQFSQIFKSNFPMLEVVFVHPLRSKLEAIKDKEFRLAVIDGETQQLKLEDILLILEKKMGHYPMFILGDESDFFSTVPDNFYKHNPINALLPLPFEIPHLRRCIIDAIKNAEMLEMTELSQQFAIEELAAVKISHFYYFSSIPYNVYTNLRQDRFYKIISENEPYPHSTIYRLVKRKIKFLYLEKNDHFKFMQDNFKTLCTLLTSNNETAGERLLTQIKCINFLHEHLRSLGFNETVMLLTKLLMNSVEGICLRLENFPALIKIFPLHFHSIAERTLLLMYLCYFMTKDLEWGNEVMQEQLVLASILYDSTLTNDDCIKFNIRNLERQLQNYTQTEREEYLQHPDKARDMAEFFRGFPDVKFIVAQHHELPNGKGFPHRLSMPQFSPLSCAFMISSHMVEEVLQRELTLKDFHFVYRDFVDRFKERKLRLVLDALKKTLAVGN